MSHAHGCCSLHSIKSAPHTYFKFMSNCFRLHRLFFFYYPSTRTTQFNHPFCMKIMAASALALEHKHGTIAFAHWLFNKSIVEAEWPCYFVKFYFKWKARRRRKKREDLKDVGLTQSRLRSATTCSTLHIKSKNIQTTQQPFGWMKLCWNYLYLQLICNTMLPGWCFLST